MSNEEVRGLKPGDAVRLLDPHFPVTCEVLDVRKVKGTVIAYVRGLRWAKGEHVAATPGMLEGLR